MTTCTASKRRSGATTARLGRELESVLRRPDRARQPVLPAQGRDRSTTWRSRFMRDMYPRYGYQEVITPQIFSADLWKRSGHYDNYRDNMYFIQEDDHELGVKPMNCPGHCVMYAATGPLLPRAAAALRRLRPAAPLRALRHAARPDPRALLRAGRRPHLLHARPDRRRDRQPDRDDARGLRRLRAGRAALHALAAARQAHRQ